MIKMSNASLGYYAIILPGFMLFNVTIHKKDVTKTTAIKITI